MHNEFSGRYTVEELPGKSFATRSAAEKAYTSMLAQQSKKTAKKEHMADPSITVSFVIKVSEREQLFRMADEQDVSLSKFIRSIVEKEVNDFGRQKN